MKQMINRRKMNNRGFTLIEVLTAMAILGVVSVAIYTFMSQGSRLYSKTTSDATIQTEAQTVANTISDLVIDCEVNISYGDYTIDGTKYENVLKIDNSDYQFLIINIDEKLFYVERSSLDNSGNYVSFDMNDAELLAENITDFACDTSRITGKKRNILTFEMTYESGGRKYSGNYQVNLRNSVTVNEVVTAPITENATLTKLTITGTNYVSIKGRDTLYASEIYPTPDPTYLAFSVSSNATNVTATKLYEWSLDSGYTGASIDSTTINDKSIKVEFDEKMYTDTASATAMSAAGTIPSSVTLTCTSLVETYEGSGQYASASVVIYYKKILGMTVTPYTGITKECIPQNTSTSTSTAVFTANYSDYNLKTSEKSCTWTLEYSTDGGTTYQTCDNDKFGSIAASTGTTAVFTLGSSATTSFKFRITATSDWDSTWDASYEFGVSEAEAETTLGTDAAARGVEIDLTALYFKLLNGTYTVYSDGTLSAKSAAWQLAACDSYGCSLVSITGVLIQNYNDDDTQDTLEIIIRDGKVYLYIDYSATRYTTTSAMLKFYLGTTYSQTIQMVITFLCSDGEYHTQNVNWYLDDVYLYASVPASNDTILIEKGDYYDVSFTTGGYNISKKSQIGFCFYNSSTKEWEDANADDSVMFDYNNYLSVNYISGLGDRYTYVNSGTFRLAAKSSTTTYPESYISCMVNISDFYKFCVAADSAYISRSYYQFYVYVANVEGEDIYISYPTEETSGFSETVVYNSTKSTTYYSASSMSMVSTTATTANVETVYSKAGEESTVGDVSFTLTPVYGSTGEINYYTLKYNGKTYYYSSGYKCWKLKSST